MLDPTFVYGAATASFQIEGANTADGRCESIWDRFCATPGKVENGDDGAVACDHYNRLEDDLDLMAELGLEAYRFSIAWPRIEPAPGEWNEAGFAFYERLIDGLLERGIKPYVTLYHWDLPQYLEERGGWISRETAHRFAEYADKVTARFGDKVVSYATLNEPLCASFVSYRWGHHAPGYADERLGYQSAHHLLLAHGLALPAMRRNAPNAEHGIVLNFTPALAADGDTHPEVLQHADNLDGFWFLHPLMTGDYPQDVWDDAPADMPTRLPGDMDIIARANDFIGINYYSARLIGLDAEGKPEEKAQTVAKTDIGWPIRPEGLTHLLLEMKRRYANLPHLLITENGACDNSEVHNGDVLDAMRTNYFQLHLQAVHDAIEKGADVRAYFAWSLMDNFEWAFGYSKRFGIVHIDYDTQVRTIKQSGKTWQAFLRDRASRR